MNMKAVHFGAGNIGRGFIGLQLSRSGYEVCFVARNEEQIALLQDKRQYPVVLANETHDVSFVRNVTAINVNNDKAVQENIARADLVTTAVGASSLKHIAKGIAKGIELRLKRNPRPLYVMACENAVGGSTQLKKMVYSHLRSEWHESANRLISFPNTIVDRIVPQQTHKDPLMVRVEPFYEWVIHRSPGMDSSKDIKGARYVDSLEPFMERKLFTVNTGHCAAAYFGYLEGHRTIQEVMNDPRLKQKVREVLEETGNVLIKKHNFKVREHQNYIQKTLERFSNPALADMVVRVGRSPIRKLSLNERLVQPLLQAYGQGMDAPHLVSAIAAALLFDYEKDAEAVKLQALLREQGIHGVVRDVVGIPEEHPVHDQIAARYEEFRHKFRVESSSVRTALPLVLK
jgi:mannitol-1-phosphate 5-dehydrogenase